MAGERLVTCIAREAHASKLCNGQHCCLCCPHCHVCFGNDFLVRPREVSEVEANLRASHFSMRNKAIGAESVRERERRAMHE